MNGKNLNVSGTEETKIGCETIFTFDNIIDVLTADDIYNGYRGIAQLAAITSEDPATKLKYKRGAIVQINNMAIAMPTAIVGNAKMRNVIVVLWVKITVPLAPSFVPSPVIGPME